MALTREERHEWIHTIIESIRISIGRGIRALDVLDGQGVLDIATEQVEVGKPSWDDPVDGHVFLPLYSALPSSDPRLNNWYTPEVVAIFAAVSGADVRPDMEYFGYHLTSSSWIIPGEETYTGDHSDDSIIDPLVDSNKYGLFERLK